MKTIHILEKANSIACNQSLTLDMKGEQLKALVDHAETRRDLDIIREATQLAAFHESVKATIRGVVA